MGLSTVWNFGQLHIEPNAPSIVPGRATLIVQMRDPSDEHLDKMETALWKAVADADAVGNSEGLGVRVQGQKNRVSVASTPMDTRLMDLIAQAAETHAPGNWTRLHSGALHDARNLAGVVPTAMLFVPSIKGISHNF